MITWSEEQLRASVTDAGTLKRGIELASPTKWGNLGRSSRALWGECQGSGSKPYQVTIDVNGPAFKCSCPSRTFPCKHGAGLMAMAVRHASLIGEAAEPAWVDAWLSKREAKETAKTEATATKAPPDPEAQAKREAQRGKRMNDGLADLERWLLDTARTGIATLQGQPPSFWENQAARLVDAQLPGLAARVRELQYLRAERTGELRDGLGELYLLTRAALRMEAQPDPVQQALTQQLGVNLKKEAVMAEQAAVHDHWLMLGQLIIEEDRLTQRRSWFFGRDTKRFALMIDHAFGKQGFASSFILNGVYEGDLFFFPGTHPIRAVANELHFRPEVPAPAPPARTLLEALDEQATLIAADPWAYQFPLWLTRVVPESHKEHWYLRHEEGLLPLHCSEDEGWSLAAQSGGVPLNIFGEWNGRTMRPVRVTATS